MRVSSAGWLPAITILAVFPLVGHVASAAPAPATAPAARASNDLDESTPEAAWAKARGLADQDRHAEALEVLHRALAKYPDDTSLQWLEAGVTGWSGKHQESVRLYEKMLAKHPEMARPVRFDLASQRLWADDPRGAIRDLDLYLEEHPEDESADRLRALALAHADRLSESIEAYDRLLLAHPDDTELALGRARALTWSGRHAQAIEAYRQVLAKSPSDEGALMGLAMNENWSGHHREAAAMFEEILRDPNADPEALKGLAYAEYWAGRPDRAYAPLERYRTARPLDPEGADLVNLLSREFHPGLTGGYDWSSDSDDLHVFTTTLEYRLVAGARGAASLQWRRDHVEDGGGTREPYRLGVGFERIWSDMWSSRAYLFSFKPAPRRNERGMGEAELTMRPSDRVRFTFGYAKEPLLTRLALERDVDVRSGSVGAEWRATSRLSLEAGHAISHYSDENRARRSSVAAAFTALRRRWFEASLTADFEHLRVRDDLDNGYYDPERYMQGGPGLRLRWTSRKAASLELVGRIGFQQEKGADSEPYHNVRAIVDVPLGNRFSINSVFETSNSNLTSASGFELNRWAAYLSVPF